MKEDVEDMVAVADAVQSVSHLLTSGHLRPKNPDLARDAFRKQIGGKKKRNN